MGIQYLKTPEVFAGLIQGTVQEVLNAQSMVDDTNFVGDHSRMEFRLSNILSFLELADEAYKGGDVETAQYALNHSKLWLAVAMREIKENWFKDGKPTG